jgi:hypothetical protein
MAVFIGKSQVTSSNCYKTIKTANDMLSLKFPFTMAIEGTSQNCQKSLVTLSYVEFSIKIDFKVLQLLNGLR